ncbi:ubiquitin carboxyl-terminal hydrolase 43-like [Mauremys mutica]|uniref:ubiquitin carboxyl-terminal hydrolase 43-like n=1 Tax=Mauremys mutica TaxID=74926 RepID=UPI001D168884|nr:ubiquitin carboxyl-terminal hydrolase 43-like [Mauremys mutica]
MGDQPRAGGRRGASPQPPKERPGRGPEPPGRRRGARRRPLRALGSLVSRLLKTLSALSRLGGGSRRGGAEPEDDEGGFRCPPGPPPAGPPGAAPPEEQVGGGSGWPEARRSWSPPGGAAEGRPPGAQGLKNHGNTCFMNAVVQCLSNTELLAEFLGLEQYRARGLPGEVTQQLAALVRALWTLDYTPQLSVEFKGVTLNHLCSVLRFSGEQLCIGWRERRATCLALWPDAHVPKYPSSCRMYHLPFLWHGYRTRLHGSALRGWGVTWKSQR